MIDTSNQNELCSMIECLTDIGCDNEVIQKYMDYQKAGEVEKQEKILIKHRHVLLNKLHKYQKQIDCLDYILYKLKKLVGSGDKTYGA